MKLEEELNQVKAEDEKERKKLDQLRGEVLQKKSQKRVNEHEKKK